MEILLFLILSAYLILAAALLYLLFGFLVWVASSADETAPLGVIFFWLPIMLSLDNE